MRHEISVLITSYNQREFLRTAIDSVLRQTVSPSEILIVDDFSQDGSQDIIEAYANKHRDRIRVLYHERNQGVSAARNHGLEMVRGEFFSTLDGDDLYLPQKLEYELSLHRKYPECLVIYSNYYHINEQGRRICRARWWPYHADGEYLIPVLSSKYIMRDMLVKTTCLEKSGVFDERLNLYEDWDWKIRLTKHYPVRYCHTPLLEYRRHSKGLASQSIHKHIAALKFVIDKNGRFLDEVPESQKRRITRSLNAVLERWQGTLALRDGRELAFVRHAMRCIGSDPLNIHTYKRLILDTVRSVRAGREEHGA